MEPQPTEVPGTTSSKNSATVEIERFLAQMEGRGCTLKTLASFERQLLALMAFNRWGEVSEFSRAGAHQFIADLALQGLAPATIDAASVCIRTLGRYLYHEGPLPPARAGPRGCQSIRDASRGSRSRGRLAGGECAAATVADLDGVRGRSTSLAAGGALMGEQQRDGPNDQWSG